MGMSVAVAAVAEIKTRNACLFIFKEAYVGEREVAAWLLGILAER